MALTQFPKTTVSVKVPAGGYTGFSVAPFMTIEKQCRSQWCWAAVLQSIASYLSCAKHTSQKELAYHVLRPLYGLPKQDFMAPVCSPMATGPSDKSIQILPFDEAGIAVMEYRGRLPTGAVTLTESELQNQLRNKRPVPMVLKWADGQGGSHAIAIVGGATGADGVSRYVAGDPFDTAAGTYTFRSLTEAYASGTRNGGRMIHAWLLGG